MEFSEYRQELYPKYVIKEAFDRWDLYFIYFSFFFSYCMKLNIITDKISKVKPNYVTSSVARQSTLMFAAKNLGVANQNCFVRGL